MRHDRNPRRRCGAALIGVLAALLISAPASAESAATARTVTDAGGRHVTIQDRSRIVSIGGAVTEILYALGLERNVVAVDTSSLYPPRALADKPNVGYMRQLSPEGVLAMSPTLALAAEGSGPPETISVLESARVPFVLIPDRFTADGIVDKIRLIAAAVDEKARGECLVGALREDLQALETARQGAARPAKVLFVLSFVNGRAVVGGQDTAADSMIRLAGGANVLAHLSGYKPVADEAIVAAQPDTVLMMERPGQTETAASVLSRPAFATTPAAARNGFIAMNGLYLLGFGPRTALAARDLAARLYRAPDDDRFAARHDAAVERCRQ